MSREGKEDIMGLKDSLGVVFNGRACQNWALVLFFMKQVSFPLNAKYNCFVHSYFSVLSGLTLSLEEVIAHLSPQQPRPSITNSSMHIFMTALNEVVIFSEGIPLREVI